MSAKYETSQTQVFGNPTIGAIVYCFGFKSFPNKVKIGFSLRGARRSSDFFHYPRILEQTTGFPEVPIVHFVVHFEDAELLEVSLHNELEGYHDKSAGGREWFEISPSEILMRSEALNQALRTIHLREALKDTDRVLNILERAASGGQFGREEMAWAKEVVRKTKKEASLGKLRADDFIYNTSDGDLVRFFAKLDDEKLQRRSRRYSRTDVDSFGGKGFGHRDSCRMKCLNPHFPSNLTFSRLQRPLMCYISVC